jgi:hypothetical protein
VRLTLTMRDDFYEETFKARNSNWRRDVLKF